MAVWRPLVRGLRALLRPGETDADVADEVAHYLEEAAAAHRARGLDPEAARRAARLETGGDLAVRDQVRSSGWEQAVDGSVKDVRYALRGLRKRPVFAATAIATIAFGIAASTAVFSVVRPILLEPLPFPEPDRLVTLDDRNDAGAPLLATLGTFDELAARSRSFANLAAADGWRPSITGTGSPERLEGQRVTGGYFDLFGAAPLLGRGFAASDMAPGAPDVVILAWSLAVRRFGAPAAVVDRTMDLDGVPHLVIGVLSPGFENVLAPSVEIWSPLRTRSTEGFGTTAWGHHYRLVGRLETARSIEDARRELTEIGSTPTADFPRPPWANLRQGLLVRSLQEAVTRDARPALVVVIASVLLLLALSSVNVANLLLARGAERQGEFAMRIALGAGRRRILRQVLTESVVLAIVGGVIGLLLAQVGIRTLVAASPPGLPRVDAIRFDGSAFLFSAVLTTLVGVLVGLAPAVSLGWGGGPGAGQEGAHRMTARRGRVRAAFVIAQVAMALTLLVGAGLLYRSIRRLLAVEPGFDPHGVLTMQVVAPAHTFTTDAAMLQFYAQALDAVRRVPGVTRAAFTSQLPLAGERDAYGYEVDLLTERPAEQSGSAFRYAVTPDYFEVMRIPVLAGRQLDPTDLPATSEAVVINTSMARRLFGSRDPVGQRLRFGPRMGAGSRWAEVVGVVGDVKHGSLALDAPDAFYVALGQWVWVDNIATLVVRARMAVAPTLVRDLTRAVWTVNSDVPILRVATMDGFVDASAGDRRFALLALEISATAALLLAALGLYGVVSGTVAERVREIGIRTALGASPASVVAQVVRQAQGLTMMGAMIGLAGTVAVGRLIASMLFGVTAFDPLTYGTAVLLLVGVALLAAWAPARRAASVDPTIALRSD